MIFELDVYSQVWFVKLDNYDRLGTKRNVDREELIKFFGGPILAGESFEMTKKMR